MKMANVTNFFVSDKEVLKHHELNQDLQKKLEKNGTIMVSAQNKNEHFKSFYIAEGAVKKTSSDEQIELIPRLLRMSGFLPA